MTRARLRTVVTAVLLWSALASPATAQVRRIQIDRREPLGNGESFGQVGPYEKIIGSLFLEVDPEHPANQRITDIKRAPRNGRGRVEVRTDFYLIKPVDPARGSGRLLYDVPNRGNKVALGTMNGAGGNDPTSGGSGFLLQRGYSILWTGWSGDVLPGAGRLTIDVPVATENGRPITGRIYAELESSGYQLYRNNQVLRNGESADKLLYSMPLDWGESRSYPPATLDNRDAILTMRPARAAQPTEVPRDQWQFARFDDGRVIPDSSQVYVQDGFRIGWLYDLVFTARNPRVTGLGFAAVRDPVSFFRYATVDQEGNPNPLAGAIRYAFAFGTSQSGRFLHHFLYEGMNDDTRGRWVFDGIIADVPGGGKGMFNYRFAATTRHGSQHEENLYASDFFPFNSVPQHDPMTGKSDDVLARARRTGRVPRIFFEQTSTEYWARAASLLHTDVQGTKDVPLDANVRIYFIAGAPHTVMSGGHYDNPLNRMSRAPVSRALLAAMDEWVTKGMEPPASRYPRIADGTLVDVATYAKGFPSIPGVRTPAVVYTPLRLDPGPRWYTQGIADHAPPRVGPAFRTLVPAVDSDGIEKAGIHLPDVSVPIATNSGWNIRAAAWGADGMLTRFMGSSVVFRRTRDEREAARDPRPSIQERYPTREVYLQRVEAAVRQLQQDRFLLPDDATALLRTASQRQFW
ncbi:MAG: alpha/beta hydrolase domain-containing protein [Longimicrobiales bacterium]